MLIYKRDSLLKLLKYLKPGLAKKELVDQFNAIVFNGPLVFTYNGDVACQVPHKEGDGFEGSVRYDKFSEVVNKVSSDELKFLISESEALIKAGKISVGLTLNSNIEDMKARLSNIGIPKKWKKLPDNFMQGLSMVLVSAGKDQTLPMLTCIHAKDSILESFDGYRYTIFNLSSDIEDEFLVSATAMSDFLPLEHLESYGVTEGWVHFKTQGMIFSCRKFSATYEDISQFTKVSGVHINIPEGLISIVERAKTFTNSEFKQDQIVSITIDPEYLSVESADAGGWFREKLKVTNKLKKPLSFKIHPDFLLDIKHILTEMTIGENMYKLEGESFVHGGSLISKE